MSQFIPHEETVPTACDVLCAMASERVLKNAHSQLRHSPYPQLWKITCEFYEGVLTLRGAVSSYFLKQLAHAAIRDVEGVEEVANRLEVCYPPSNPNDRRV